MAKCEHCRRGPSGIEGHERLFSHTFNHALMQFKCRECGALWIRRYGANSTYTWSSPAGEHAGVDVPGRPGTMPP